MFQSLYASIDLARKHEPCDSGFQYVFNCEETEFDDFELEADIQTVEAQLKEIEEYSEIEIVQNGKEPFAEFTRIICSAYPKGVKEPIDYVANP